MKKNLLAILFTITVAVVNAQPPCVPDQQYTTAGVYPDSITNLPPACMDELYDIVVTVVVPYDTCGTFQIVGNACLHFDSVQVKNPNNVNMNLPPNFSVACDPPDCMFQGPTIQGQVVKKCMSINGMPTAPLTAPDTFPLHVDVNAWLTVLPPHFLAGQQIETDASGVNLDVDYYYIAIRPTGQCGTRIGEEKQNTFSVRQNSPNPFNKNTKIEFTNNKSGIVDFTVYNMIGEIVLSEKVTSKKGAQNIIFFNSSNFHSGIYSYSLNNGEKTISKRMILMGN